MVEKKNTVRDNQQAGRNAKNQGKIFEDVFERACLALSDGGLACTRVPDGCKQVGLKRLIRVRSPWDWVVTWNNTTALLDTKSMGKKAFGFSDIDEAQARELGKHERAGGIAGYVVWLRASSTVIFIPARELIKNVGTGGSFKPTDPGIINLGRLAVEGERTAGYIEICRIFKETS